MSFKSFLFLAWKCPKPIGKSLIHWYSHAAYPWWKSCRRAVFTAAVSTKQRFHFVFPSLQRLHPAFCVPPRSGGRACSHDVLTQRQWFSLRLHTFKKKEKNWADLYFRLARADTPSAQCWFLFFPGYVSLTHQAVRTMSLGVTCQIHLQCKCCVRDLWSANVPF